MVVFGHYWNIKYYYYYSSCQIQFHIFVLRFISPPCTGVKRKNTLVNPNKICGGYMFNTICLIQETAYTVMSF